MWESLCVSEWERVKEKEKKRKDKNKSWKTGREWLHKSKEYKYV